MPTPIHEIDDDNACDDSPSVWPLLATGSGLLGNLAGRISSQRDLRAALRQIEEL